MQPRNSHDTSVKNNYYVAEQLRYIRDPRTGRGWRRRYDFALQHVRPEDTVLDCGCGIGEGTTLLARQSGRAVGIDIDDQFILFCRKLHPEIEFQRCDAAHSLPFPDNHFDVIVALQVFEHMPSRHDVKRALENMHKVLKPGGFFIASSPNALSSDTTVLLKYGKHLLLNTIGWLIKKQARWHEHYRIWTPQAFRATLASRFGSVSVFGQRIEGITQDVERSPCLIARARK